MIEHINHKTIEKLLTPNQIELLCVKYDIISKVDRSKPIDPQLRKLSESFIRAGYPISYKGVQKYWLKYKNL